MAPEVEEDFEAGRSKTLEFKNVEANLLASHREAKDAIGNDDPFVNLEHLRDQINRPFFMEIIVLLSWAIWMTRNNKILKQINASIQGCKALFLLEMDAMLLHAKKAYSPRLQEWISGVS